MNIRGEKGNVTDYAISHGVYTDTMFVISAEGNLYRRKPGSANEYAKVGALTNPTDERRAALLEALRNANPDREFQQITGDIRRAHYANYKQACTILNKFNK